MKAGTVSLGSAGCVLAVIFGLGMGLSAPAAAQVVAPADTLRVQGRTVTLALDEDGRLLIDGRPARLDREPLVVMFDADDRVVVFGPDRVVRRRLHPGTPPRVFFEADKADTVRFHLEQELEGLDETLSEMGERLKIELGPPMRGALEEADFFRRYFEGRDWGEQAGVVRMEQEAHRLAREARQAEGAERRRLERELREQLDALLDRKLTLREERIEHLMEEAEEQREQLRERRARRDEIIERRLRELLGEDDVLDW